MILIVVFILITIFMSGFLTGHYHHIWQRQKIDDAEIYPSHRPLKKSDAALNVSATEVIIDYKDAKGKETQRPIHVVGVGETRHGDRIVMAYCFKRENVRSFRIDRMIDVIDSDGIIHDPVQYFADWK